MAPDAPRSPEELVSEYWDKFIVAEPVPAGFDFPDLAELIHHVHALDDTPSPDPGLKERVWRQVTGEPFPAPPVEAPGTLPDPNGHLPLENNARARMRTSPAEGRGIALVRHGATAYRLLAIGVLAGMVAGAIGGGLGARLAMRLSAILAGPALQGANTDNGNTVGTVSAEGTIGLIVFSGMIFGIVGGVLYVAVRAWLPWNGWRRGLAFGSLLLVTFGFVVMDPDNPDYRRFGSPVVNVCAFSLVYIVFGLLVGPVADWLDRELPRCPAHPTLRCRPGLGFAALAPFALLGVLMIVAVGLGFAPATGLVFLSLVLGAPTLRQFAVRPETREGQPAPMLRLSRGSLAGYALLIVPSLVGFGLTVRAITGILGTG